MAQLFINNARGVLANSVSTGDTLLTVSQAVNIPASLVAGDFFLLTLFRDTTRYGENVEVVKVTAVSAGANGQLNLTVVRGYEFPAQIHAAGTRLEARLTAQSLRELLDEAATYTDAQIAALIGGAPGALDTLNELAAALADDADYATTVTNQLATKLDASSYTAVDVLAKLLTVDGAGSGLDADLLDGKHASEFEVSGAVAAHEAAADPHPQYLTLQEIKDRQALLESATLDLGFKRGKYALDDGERTETTVANDLLTVTRATSKWVFGPNGKLREVPPDTIARQWDPVTGEPLGALLEESATNLQLYSTDMTNANVTRQNCDITVSTETSPIEGKSAFTLTAVADGISGAEPNTFSVTAGKKYTVTLSAKGADSLAISPILKNFQSIGWQAGVINFDGTLDPTTGGGWRLDEQLNLPDGWTFARVSCVADQSVSNASVQYRVTQKDGANPLAGEAIHIAHWQVEEGDGSSIIPTTTSPVTRAADNVQRTLGSEFNPSGFTFFAEFFVPPDTAISPNIWSSSSSNIRLEIADLSAIVVLAGIGGGYNNTGFVVTPGETSKIALSFTDTECLVSGNGQPAVSIPITGISSSDIEGVYVGSRSPGKNVLDGTMSVFSIYGAMSAAELEALTS